MSIGAVFTVNDNVDVYIDKLIARSGGPNLFVSLQSGGFDEVDIQKISGMTSVRYLSFDFTTPLNVLWESKSFRMYGILASPSYVDARPVEVMAGSFLSEWDYKAPSNNVVVSPQTLKTLGLSYQEAIGKPLSLNLKDRTLIGTIVGVAIPRFDNNDRGYVWATETLVQGLTQSTGRGSMIVGFPFYSELENYEATLREVLSKKYGEGFEIYNPKKYFELMRNDYQMFIRAGLVVGLLALLAGSVGVMNTMSAGVQLRVREIGLYRALGFPSRVVLLTFLAEALMILTLGGLAGAVGGSLFGMVISSQVALTNPFFSPSAFCVALISSLAIGFFFAYLPAARAARLETVEALKG